MYCRLIDMTGQKFGRWLVLSRAENNRRGEVHWHCVCECGRERVVVSYNLRSGRSRSCDCLLREVQAARRPIFKIGERHGHAKTGMRTREYVAWRFRRTKDKSFPDFTSFLKMVGPSFPGAHLHRLPSGRFEWRRGKLSMEKAREIRALAAQGITQKALAQQFGVGKSIVSSIVLNQKWREAA